MSNFTALTRKVGDKEYKRAYWLDDYFGWHHYGVRFEGEEEVLDPRKVKLETKPFNPLQSKLDRIELKLKEQLSENYFNGKEGRNNFAADTANYLTGFIIGILGIDDETTKS